MKKSLFFILLAALQCSVCLGQSTSEFAPEFGKYHANEFELRRYEKDTTAEAVVFYEIGKTYFRDVDYSFNSVFEYTTRIKILSQAGLSQANFEIPYYIGSSDMELVRDIGGYTYNLTNENRYEKTPLNVKTVYDEDYSRNWKVKKIAMPNVRVGSIVEIKYSISSPYLFNFRSWSYQKRIPVMYSQYVTRMIPFYTYDFILQGSPKFDEYNASPDTYERIYGPVKYKEMVYNFVMKDVPAFKDEAFITCPDDYIVKQDFQLSEVINPDGVKNSVLSTWPKFVREMLKLPEIGGYLKNAGALAKKQVLDLNLSLKSPMEQAEIIDRFMKSNFNWNGKESMYTSQSVKKFTETKTGNVSEINLYYVALLQAAGINAFPVILSTRDHGKIQINYPFEHFFNYVVAGFLVDGKINLLDATEPFAAFCLLPSRCINDNGLIFKNYKEKDQVEWVKMGGSKKSVIAYHIDLTPNLNNDSLSGSFRVISNGFDAIDFRKKYTFHLEDLKKEMLASTMMLKDTIGVANLLIANKPIHFIFSATNGMSVFDDKISFTAFCSFISSVNPLQQPTRTYPIDLTYKQEKQFFVTIHIPDGYRLLNAPAKVHIENDNVKIQMTTNPVEGSILTIIGGYEFKKEVFPAESYDEIKGYFRKITNMFNEEVVLEKIKS